jgi:glycosyltransferase involved in cell wall biosynthesis
MDSLFESRHSRGVKSLILRWEASTWDAYIVLNDKSELAVRHHVGEGTETGRWTPSSPLGDPFGQVVSRQSGPVLSILHGDGDSIWSKGLDRIAAASRRLIESGSQPVSVYGIWPSEIKSRYESELEFAGLGQPTKFLRGASLLLHLSRSDAFGLAVIEAMTAGVPPVVADAGSAKVVANVEAKLVVSDVDQAVAVARWIKGMTGDEYAELSARIRTEALSYIQQSTSGKALDEIRRVLFSEKSRHHSVGIGTSHAR